jgi:hypothetical protein
MSLDCYVRPKLLVGAADFWPVVVLACATHLMIGIRRLLLNLWYAPPFNEVAQLASVTELVHAARRICLGFVHPNIHAIVRAFGGE